MGKCSVGLKPDSERISRAENFKEKGLSMQDVIDAIQQFGFPVVMMVGLGYFVYFVWTTITEKIDPAIEKSKITLIQLIDQIRMLDQDMIRLQKKLDTVLEMKENERKKPK